MATITDDYKAEQTLFREHEEAIRCIDVLTSSSSDKAALNDALSNLRTILDKYLEAPTLLDPHLSSLVVPLGTCCQQQHLSTRGNALSALYSISKVRGRKRMVPFLPNDVCLIQPVLEELHRLHDEEETSQQWQSTYILWFWLSLLSLTPFDRKIVLKEIEIESLLELAKSHLSKPGPTREAAAHCLASWLARQDMVDFLEHFICDDGMTILGRHSNSNIFETLGVLQTLATILKVGTREVYKLQLPLWDCILKRSSSDSNNRLMRKLITKWMIRMACAHMPPRIAKWRYKRGGRTSLLENLNKGNHVAAADETIANHNAETEEDLLFKVPDLVEDVMGHLLGALKDKATVVRWSAAKGIARLTERLPRLCAHDVLDGLLKQLERNRDSDTVWHGSCLALGELARRGLLLPDRLSQVIDPILIPAMHFDIRKGQTSVGAHVRDAACYTYWAFARAYTPEILRPYYVGKMSSALVVASLFDREINCRRAASAAFQESVGRQGAQNFPHGIEILTKADYISLGNRTEAYTTIAFQIANYSEYRQPIINHVHKIKLYHWDENIRKLASKSLHGLTALDTEYMQETVIPSLLKNTTNPDLFVRHGGVLGVAETLLALGGANVSESLADSLAELVPKLEKLRLYRGRGGEIMRAAMCRYVECASLAQLKLSVKQQVRLLDSVDENLKHPNEDTQSAAGCALSALMRSYFPVGEKGPSDRLQKRVVSKYANLVTTSKHPAETRGYALALGSLPKKLLAPSDDVLDTVLNCLCQAARFDAKVGLDSDAETRRNSLQALIRLCEEVGFDSMGVSPMVGLTDSRLQQVFEALLLGLADYNTDRRGDVGSWSRVVVMTGLEQLLYLANRNNNKVQVSIHVTTRILGGLLKQLCERLDNVRGHAGECLHRLLENLASSHGSSTISVSFAAELSEALEIGKETNWTNARSTFPRAMKAANIKEMFPFVIAGIVTSIGGLTGTVTREAEEALINWIRGAEGCGKQSIERTDSICQAFLDLFQQYRGKRRVVLPLLKTIESLLNRGLLNSALANRERQFGASFLVCLDIETKTCQDVHRLLAAVGVALGCLSDLNELHVNEGFLLFILGLLAHAFPRVRKYTADNLYVRLLEDSSVLPSTENEEAALELLLQGQWDADFLDQAEFEKLVTKFASLISVSFVCTSGCSAIIHTESKSSPKSSAMDEFASYASLINDMLS